MLSEWHRNYPLQTLSLPIQQSEPGGQAQCVVVLSTPHPSFPDFINCLLTRDS